MKKFHNWIQKNLGYDGIEIIAIVLGINYLPTNLLTQEFHNCGVL